MLYAVTGRPGEGKTCYAVQHLILDELENGDRPIYTNIWLHRGKIKHYLRKQGIKVDLKRLHYLEEHQIRRFWIYAEKNALMVLDEVGEFFNANAWKELQADPQWDPASYARLHRKVGHETYLIVQDLNHIYKQYRDLIQFHIQLVNASYRKFLGFRGPKIFIAKKFDLATNKHKPSEDPKTYKFDKKVFDLYDTSQVYSVNSGVKTNESKKYKKTEKSQEKSKLFRRGVKATLGWLSAHSWTLLIICIIIGLIFVLKNAPTFISGLIKTRQADMEAASPEEETTEPIKEETKDDEKITLNNVVKTATGGWGTRKGTGTNVSTVRYDSVNKRNP